MATEALLASAFHPSEMIALLRYKFLAADKTQFKDVSSLPPPSDSSYSYALCYYYLNKTSRSFARVIQELDPELRHPVCLFYLILRGLDTIEDDMTLDPAIKQDLLKTFDTIIYKKGWNFDGNGAGEKDRILLERFDVVIDQFLQLKPEYQETIKDITHRMGHGMAEFCAGKTVETLEDYKLYTHYVAGLVGIGLTRLFVNSKLESKSLLESEDLANTMGLFLQKTNILKDYLTDLDEGRLFWPSDIWKLYVEPGESVGVLAQSDHLPRALACLNHLIVDALELVPDTLEYLSRLQNKTVFQFAAIPQLMAIASLAHFYNNPLLFQKKGNKIRRGLAVKLIFQSGDLETVKRVYYAYALELNAKNRDVLGRNVYDKSFLRMSAACSNIVRWIQEHDKKMGQTVIRGKSSDSGFPWMVVLGVIAFLVLMSRVPGVQ